MIHPVLLDRNEMILSQSRTSNKNECIGSGEFYNHVDNTCKKCEKGLEPIIKMTGVHAHICCNKPDMADWDNKGDTCEWSCTNGYIKSGDSCVSDKQYCKNNGDCDDDKYCHNDIPKCLDDGAAVNDCTSISSDICDKITPSYCKLNPKVKDMIGNINACCSNKFKHLVINPEDATWLSKRTYTDTCYMDTTNFNDADNKTLKTLVANNLFLQNYPLMGTYTTITDENTCNQKGHTWCTNKSTVFPGFPEFFMENPCPESLKTMMIGNKDASVCVKGTVLSPDDALPIFKDMFRVSRDDGKPSDPPEYFTGGIVQGATPAALGIKKDTITRALDEAVSSKKACENCVHMNEV